MSTVSASKPYVLLLTSRPAGWASTRFRSAARERGVRLRAADPTRSFLEVEPDGVSVRIAGRKLHPPVSVLPRLGPGNYEDGLATLGHLEASGVPACNSRKAIDIARDTLRGLLALTKLPPQFNVTDDGAVKRIEDFFAIPPLRT